MDVFGGNRKRMSGHVLPGIFFALLLCLPDMADAARKGEKLQTVDEIRDGITVSVMEKAAKEDDLAAQLWLADRYFTGRDGSQNYARALYWYRKAAEKGARDAWYNLGVMHILGKGVEKDPEAGAGWLEKAALQGDVEAQYFLGQMYFNGQGVRVDQEVAASWWEMGAAREEKKSLYNLGLSHYHGQGVRQDDVMAVDLWRRAAEQGMKEARYNLAIMYDEGRGVPQDRAKALELFTRAAEQGHPLAQVALGRIYETGWQEVPADILEAMKWYEMAAAQDMAQARQRLLFLRGAAGFGMAE